MLKGKAVIELTDVNTGQKEIYEETNLVTEAVADRGDRLSGRGGMTWQIK